jgi:hypothetical protein
MGTGIVVPVLANDGAPNDVFWVKNNKINCLSVINPEDIGDNYFLLFDYSPRVGQERGKPWVILEKGKCYEVDEEGGVLYRITIVNGDERQQYSDYARYQSTDDIASNVNDNIFPNVNIIGMWPIAYTGREEYRLHAIYFTWIRAREVFPTKYDFGAPITERAVLPSREADEMVNDQSYLAIQKLYTDLAIELGDTIRSCDTRIRVEHQLSVEQNNYVSEKNVIWRLSNNEDFGFSVAQKITSLEAIEKIGCRESFSEFINTHKSDFNTIDRLSEEFISKYPNAVAISGEYGPIMERDSAVSQKILAFVDTDSPVFIETSTNEDSIKATLLDEPTTEEKGNLLFNSENLLMQAYIYLPIFALIGIIVFFVLKKRQK